MKILRLLCLFLIIVCFNNAYPDNIKNMYNDIYNLEQALDKNQQTPLTLYKGKKTLKNAPPTLNACINEENQKLLKLKNKISFLNKIYLEPEVIALKKIKEFEYKQHLNKLLICEYLNFQISELNQRLTSTMEHFYVKNLLDRQTNIYSFLTHLDEHQFKFSSTGDLVNEISQYKNILRVFRVLLIGFFLFFILNLQKKYRPSWMEKINLLKYARSFCIYAITAPGVYLEFHIIFFQKNDILRSFFDRPIAYVSVGMYLFYLYKFVNLSSCKRDIIFSTTLFLINILLLIFICQINILRFSGDINSLILPFEFAILFLLAPISIGVCYFCLNKILNIKVSPNLIIISSLIFFTSILLLGLLGYINLAINLNLIIIFDTLAFTWIMVLLKICSLFLENLCNSKTRTHQFLQKRFHEQTRSVIFHIKIILTSFIIFFVTYDIGAMIYITNPFLKEEYILNIYTFLFTNRIHGPFSFTFYSLGEALEYFVIFNIINFLISRNLARKVYADHKSRVKTTKLFNLIGYIINGLLTISITNIHIKNFVFISGGMIVVIGFALQSIASKFFSSILLYLHPPYELGDYIEIQNTKGFVKKITLLETHIETRDNNTIILPNQYISSTTIENFNYENKSFIKIHIHYILNELNTNQEETIKNKLRKIIQMDSNVIKNKNQPVEFIFSLFSLSPDSYQLEIIFCYIKQHNLKMELTALNRKIAICLKSMNLDAKFDGMQFPSG